MPTATPNRAFSVGSDMMVVGGVIDERGRQVSGERLLWALAAAVAPSGGRQPVVLEINSQASVHRQFLAGPFNVVDGLPTREGMQQPLLATQGSFGGGPSGRIWLRGEEPDSGAIYSDALYTAGALLQLLSQRDWPLSAVLERG